MPIPAADLSLGGLISGDAHLTDAAINNLWQWFSAAIKDGADTQQVFLRMVDSIRKPYINHLATIDPGSLTPSESGQTVTELEDLPSYGCDLSDTTQSHEGVMQKGLSKIKHQKAQLEEKVNSIPWASNLWDTIQALEDPIHTLCKELAEIKHQKAQLEEKISSIPCAPDLLNTVRAHEDAIHILRNEVAEIKRQKAQLEEPDPVAPMIIRVAIKSVWFSNRYVQLDGEGVTSFQELGGGQVDVSTSLLSSETFELVRHAATEPNIVSFKSTTFENVFLRAEAAGLLEGSSTGPGGGVVNCQFGCGESEKFRLRRAGDQGELAIESIAFPGRYFRLDGNDRGKINLQGVINAWGKFYLVVVL